LTRIFCEEANTKNVSQQQQQGSKASSKTNSSAAVDAASSFSLFAEKATVNTSHLILEQEKAKNNKNIHNVYKRLNLHSLQDMKLLCSRRGIKESGSREVVKKRILHYLREYLDA